MTSLFDSISLLFMGFVFIISSLVNLYSDYYIFGNLNIIRFILLVLIFFVSIIFLIIGPNVISILLLGGRQTCTEWWSPTLPTVVSMSVVHDSTISPYERFITETLAVHSHVKSCAV
jgi:hypothetical protein